MFGKRKVEAKEFFVTYNSGKDTLWRRSQEDLQVTRQFSPGQPVRVVSRAEPVRCKACGRLYQKRPEVCDNQLQHRVRYVDDEGRQVHPTGSNASKAKPGYWKACGSKEFVGFLDFEDLKECARGNPEWVLEE